LGHSLGGVLSLLAAIKAPSLFKAVIMLDSPLIGPFKSSIVRIAKALGIIDHITPASRTKDRREYWQNREQLVDYLRTRELFKTFSDECLNDYISYGLERKPDGYHLRFDRRIEYQIYRTIPHIIPKLQGKLITPTALIYGDKSTVVDRMDRRYMRTHFGIKTFKIKGTHLFPMESPDIVAGQVFNALDAIV
jgi:pimeloyl-ACP methyl ester carboxylesterase